ncbi:hypothetical protein G8770_01890 [Aestuariicella hydrocarbonica]|uniref:Uncharacterized protein n=1 Tax=Pseudomaricurvus hydrocarbonicus TaxID=1470433 RepID=A0A9E5MJP4_9GAMM|nr:hypothetical protein [Aestuariicella hydrocarbonica]NHO64297.1 hypothetical protein [Aestuariicella hydrocarbonica]
MYELIPPPHQTPFSSGIRHPELYLWDAWSFENEGVLHLYCLAVNRQKPDGSRLLPAERNHYPFHIRHFESVDAGGQWWDKGSFHAAGSAPNGQDVRNVWSGCSFILEDGRLAAGYTGLYAGDPDHTFIQNMGVAYSPDGRHIERFGNTPLSCPVVDFDNILTSGYYLPPLEQLGHNAGEEGGPILAWRDPFIFRTLTGELRALWAAKVSPTRGAIAQARLDYRGGELSMGELLPPILLPESQTFTQIELPKIYVDQTRQEYYLVVATCDRLTESQAEHEVEKAIRLYRASQPEGPWQPLFSNNGRLPNSDHLYAMTVLKTDFDRRQLLCIAPCAETAGDRLGLSISPAFTLDIPAPY